jgi:ABC-type multidrug transport system ATPase subunit
MNALLTADRVSMAYGRAEALSDVTLSVIRGEAVALIGPNGAGKTTLLRLLVGILRPSRGEIRIAGDLVPAALTHTRVAYFGGEMTMPPGVTVAAWRSLFQEPSSHDHDRRLLGTLSRGTRQMVGLRTVFSLPALQLIALDEPWEGLDPDAARWLGEAVRARRGNGAALILSSHRLHDLAGLCDRYLFLNAGRLLSMSARAVCADGPVTADALFAVFDRLRQEAP